MKKFVFVALLTFAFQTPAAMAWTGGPWSNDSFSPGGEQGTYQATATMSNGSGLMRFEVTNNPFFSGQQGLQGADAGTAGHNVSVWWYRGATYYGNTNAIVDIAARYVGGINSATSGDADAMNNTGRNVERLTAHWTAHIYDRAPQLRFQGSGTVRLFGDQPTEVTTRVYNVTYREGDILSDPAGNVLFSINVNTENTTITGSGGNDPNFPTLGARESIRVFGSRTSWVAFGSSATRTNGLIQLPGTQN